MLTIVLYDFVFFACLFLLRFFVIIVSNNILTESNKIFKLGPLFCSQIALNIVLLHHCKSLIFSQLSPLVFLIIFPVKKEFFVFQYNL